MSILYFGQENNTNLTESYKKIARKIKAQAMLIEVKKNLYNG